MNIPHNITVEDSSPLLTYNGDWQDSPNDAPDYDKYSGYAAPEFASFHVTNLTSSFDFPFNGTAIFVYGTVGSAGGPFDVLVSNVGTNSDTLDSSIGSSRAANTTYQSLLYSHSGMDKSVPHNLHISNQGQGIFILDYIVVQNEVGDQWSNGTGIWRYDDTDPKFQYLGGTWNVSRPEYGGPVEDHLYMGAEHSSSDIGAQVQFDFYGAGLAIHGTWFTGGYTVTLDGVEDTVVKGNITGKVNLYNRPCELLYMTDGLVNKNHTVILTNAGDVTGQWNFLSIDYAVVSEPLRALNSNGMPISTVTAALSSPTNAGFILAPVSLQSTYFIILFLWMTLKSVHLA